MKRKRIYALFIDLFFVTLLAICMASIPKFNPYYEDADKAEERFRNSSISFLEMESTEKAKEQLQEMSETLYYYEKTQIMQYGWYLLFYVGYFIIFAYFNKGSTLGKKIMHLRVISDNGGDVSLKSLEIRALLNGTRLFYGVNGCVLLKIITLLLMKGTILFSLIYSLISFLSFGIEIGNLVLFLNHDSGNCLIDQLSKSHVEEF